MAPDDPADPSGDGASASASVADSAGDHSALRGFFAAVRRRLRLRHAASESLWIGAASGVVLPALLLVAGVAPRLAPGLKTLLGLTVIAAAIGVGRAFGRPARLWRDDEAIARWVSAASGDGDLLLSAAELARDLPSLAAQGSSVELARAVIREGARRCSGIDPRRLVGFEPVRRARRALGASLLGALLILLCAPGAARRGYAALTTRPPDAAVAIEPIVGDLDLTLTYPRHTHLPPRSIPGTSGGVLAPPGTEVSFRARALLPVERAELLLEDAEHVPLAVRPVAVKAQVLSGSFRVEPIATAGERAAMPVGYRFVFRPPSGGKLAEPEPHRIDLEPDRAPRVDLQAPADDLEVAGPRRIELAWSADDDYGLGEIALVWRPATGSGGGEGPAEQRKILRKGPAPAQTPGRSASGRFEWDLAELELQPGVRVAYHLEARDNDEVSGPNLGVSRTLYVRIFSPAEKHAELLTDEQGLVEHAVNLLGDRIDAERFARLPDVESVEPLAPQRELDDWSTAHGKSEAFLGELGRVAANLDKDPLAPKDLKPALGGINERLGRMVREEELGLRGLKEKGHQSKLERAALRPLRDGNPRHVAELERDTLLLDDLLSRQRLEELLAVADEMAQARDRLKKLLTEYKGARSEALRREIEREMRTLERKLAELAEKAARLRGEVPDEFLNREAMGDSDLGKRLSSIRELLDKGDVDKAMEELQRLSSSLDKMMQAMERDLRGFRDERFSAEEKALSELENQLADLEHDERQIQAETESVRGEEKKRAQELMRDRVEPFLKQAREQAAELKRRVSAIDPQAVPPSGDEPLEHAQRAADDLAHALEQADLDQARGASRKAERTLGELGKELSKEVERQWEGMRAAARKAGGEVAEGAALAKRIADEIDQALPKAGELLSPAERRRMDELSKRQQGLKQRTDELRGKGREAGDAGKTVGDGLKQAAQHMDRAAQHLGQGEPRDSSGEEGQAADRLREAQRQVQQQRRPRQNGGPGAQSSKETVKIPGADDYQGPREFRQDLLDAMKREAPKDYRDQVKRYYEELAR